MCVPNIRHQAMMNTTAGYPSAVIRSPRPADRFVVVNWTRPLKIDVSKWQNIQPLVARVGTRPTVQQTLKAEHDAWPHGIELAVAEDLMLAQRCVGIERGKLAHHCVNCSWGLAADRR